VRSETRRARLPLILGVPGARGLAALLGRGSTANLDFIGAFATELLEGAANLLLNGHKGSRCRRPE
jgi:hypothetical protein